MDLELDGKKAIVTGGSRGIGKAIARQLALEGVDVGIAARDQARVDAAAEELAGRDRAADLPLGVRHGRRRVGAGDGRTASPASSAGVDILVNAAAKAGRRGCACRSSPSSPTEALWERGEHEGHGLPALCS